MSFSDSSDEDNKQFEYWNDWEPPGSQTIVKRNETSEHNCFTSNVLHHNKKICVSGVQGNLKFGNWIPPSNFLNPCGDIISKKVPAQKTQIEVDEEIKQNSEANREKLNRSTPGLLNESAYNTAVAYKTEWKRKINLDWGDRVQLHDVTKYKDGDLFWGIVNLGCFALIKLWVNDYGNICGLAEGTISKVGSSETSLISISSTELLRRMLNITNIQWVSLCEIIQETTAALKFEAQNECDLLEKSSLEKLWWFVCKRRHFISELCMLVKLNGAVKCLKEFKIIPKLEVQDIRDIQGHQNF